MPKTIEQVAVIAVHNGKICVVTSSKGTRWVLPKGMIDPGHSPIQAAMIEAWEEAGLTGFVEPEPIGSYSYKKDGRRFFVSVFVMNVEGISAVWPESFRKREWLHPEIAILRFHEDELKLLVREWHQKQNLDSNINSQSSDSVA